MGRHAPGVREMVTSQIAMHAADQAGERVEAKVPCNGCTACCHFSRIDVDPSRELPEDLAHLDLIADPDPPVPGGLMLRKRADGACIHLGPDGCTVHAHRPRACRLYDCRVGAVAGLWETYGTSDQRAPLWVTEQRTDEQRTWASGLQFCAQEFVKQRSDQSWVASDAIEYAYAKFRERLPMMERSLELLRTLSPKEKQQLLAEMRARGLPALEPRTTEGEARS
jgi:hypothetical protein